MSVGFLRHETCHILSIAYRYRETIPIRWFPFEPKKKQFD